MLNSGNNSLNDIELLWGQLPSKRMALETFSDSAITFLDDLSKEILQDKALNSFTDLKTFSFWCRAANIQRIKSTYQNKRKSIGRGIALHITPSNVAMNFAYSLAFGLLAGNVNIVRIPSRNFIQVEAFIQKVKFVLTKHEHERIRGFIYLVKYERSNTVSKTLSALADVRLIWGGDETITNFKQYPTKPRCLDLTFSNRYSLALINPAAIKDLTDKELKKITERFFNDCYFMDQRGCSSPQSVIWTSYGNRTEKNRFWESLTTTVTEKYDYNISVAADKLVTLAEAAVNSDIDFKLLKSNFLVSRLEINELPQVETIKCNFGIFAEASINELNQLNSFITEKYQTLTYFGLIKEDIEVALGEGNYAGIDRIVPFGRAFDMEHIWDGYDIITAASRIIGD